MEEVFIIDALRSPIGTFLGSLSKLPATKIGSVVIRQLLKTNDIRMNKIDELITGNVLSAGLGQNPAKQLIVYSKLPNSIPAYSVNMVCASGLQAVIQGYRAIASGGADIVLAGGVESMSNSRFLLERDSIKASISGTMKLDSYIESMKASGINMENLLLKDEMVYCGLQDCYSGDHMGAMAELISEKYGITREEQDKFSLDSHKKALKARNDGLFDDEIVPIDIEGAKLKNDEGIRPNANLDAMSRLKTVFKEGGTVTAGNSSQLSDGASFLLLISGKKKKELGLRPLAKIAGYSMVGNDPSWYGMAPVAAIKNLLNRTNTTLKDIDQLEINEAFAAQTLGVVKELGIDSSKLNMNGGAIALGHPIGASGARILTTLLHSMKRNGAKRGIAALCHGGGGAPAILVENMD